MLDVHRGFWHVPLDGPPSLLITYNTLFGSYRWKCMLFGISSAPQVFQRRMHKVTEGLKGVEVIADDFVVVGFGDSIQDATKDHNSNLEAFLEHCTVKHLKLNNKKLRLRLQEVPFISHVAMSEGLRADPYKVQGIMEMPPSPHQCGSSAAHLLGLAQYLSKLLLHLSDITKSLRELTQKDSGAKHSMMLRRSYDKHSCPTLLQLERRGHTAV